MLTNDDIKSYFRFQCSYCGENYDTNKDATVAEKKVTLLNHIDSRHYVRIPYETPEQDKLDYFRGMTVYENGKPVESPMID